MISAASHQRCGRIVAGLIIHYLNRHKKKVVTLDDIKRCLMAVKPGSADYSPQIDVDSKIIFEGIPPAFKSEVTAVATSKNAWSKAVVSYLKQEEERLENLQKRAVSAGGRKVPSKSTPSKAPPATGTKSVGSGYMRQHYDGNLHRTKAAAALVSPPAAKVPARVPPPSPAHSLSGHLSSLNIGPKAKPAPYVGIAQPRGASTSPIMNTAVKAPIHTSYPAAAAPTHLRMKAPLTQLGVRDYNKKITGTSSSSFSIASPPVRPALKAPRPIMPAAPPLPTAPVAGTSIKKRTRAEDLESTASARGVSKRLKRAEELIEELATNKAQAEEARKKLKSLEAARARLEHQLEFTVKFASKEANEMAELEEGQSDMDTA